MIFLRSLLHTLYFYGWSAAFALSFLPVLGWAKLTRNRFLVQRIARIWTGGLIGGARVFGGIGYKIRGRENIPRGAVILAAKHQSAFETLLFHLLVPDPVYVLKKELGDSPLIGWYLKGSGAISIDRKAGARAAKEMVAAAKTALAEDAQIVIFPEGTRVPIGEHRPYQPGVGILYAFTKVPVVPVAMNSGVFWPRKGFLIRPGRIIVEFLEPIPPGLNQKELMPLLETLIEERSDALVAEANATS